MNWKTRLKLGFGMLGVLFLAIGLLAYVDKTRSVVAAQEAQLQAESYTVGLGYSGDVVEQYVQEGDIVEKGQTLFKVKSTVLLNSIKEFDLGPEELQNPIDEDGNVIITAAKDGIVSKIDHSQGSFVPANEALATIIDVNSVYAQAVYRLPRNDFALLSRDTSMKVRLPNGDYATGSVTKIDVLEQNDVVITQVQSEIETDASTFLVGTSTPVTADLVLRTDTYYDRAADYVGTVFTDIKDLISGRT